MPSRKSSYRPVRYFCQRKNFNSASSKEQTNTKTVSSKEKLSLKQSQGNSRNVKYSSEITNSPGQHFPINNILVLPKNSDTLINVIHQKKTKIPFKKLLRKLRKEKQKMKKKNMKFEKDVKPEISELNVKDLKNPKINKHTIILSDSEEEVVIIKNFTDSKIPDSVSCQTSQKNHTSYQQDDDVVIIETPQKNDVIEIDDVDLCDDSKNESNYEPNERNKIMSTPDSSGSNDFIDNSHSKTPSKFNFSLHGSDFKDSEFLRPCVPVDISESGSISSVSDVSTTIKANVFNVVEFPKEKDNLFDENNLDKFKDSITPNRNYKKNTDVQKNLPTLSDIRRVEDSIDNDQRKVRGRSIIKEMVNDRAYVLLSSSQKKIKNKKRKSRSEDNDSNEEDELNETKYKLKKRKKKKSRKKEDDDYIEFTEVTEDDIIVTSSPITKNVGTKGKRESISDKNEIPESTPEPDIFLENILTDKSKNKKKKESENQDHFISDTESPPEINKKRKKENSYTASSSAQDHDFETEDNSKTKKKKKRKGDDEILNSLNKSNSINIENDEVETNETKKKRKKNKSISESSSFMEKNTDIVLAEVEEENDIGNYQNEFPSIQITNVMSLKEETENIPVDNNSFKVNVEVSEKIEVTKEKSDQIGEIVQIQEKALKVEDKPEGAITSINASTDCLKETISDDHKITNSSPDSSSNKSPLPNESNDINEESNNEVIDSTNSVKLEKETDSNNELQIIMNNSSSKDKEKEKSLQINTENDKNETIENTTVKIERSDEEPNQTSIVEKKLPNFIENMVRKNDKSLRELCAYLERSKDTNEIFEKISMIKDAFSTENTSTSVQGTSQSEKEDILETMSISSSSSSIICIENTTVIDVDDDITSDITLANCDVPKNNKEIENLEESIMIIQEESINNRSNVSARNSLLSDELTKRNDSLMGNSSPTKEKRNSVEKKPTQIEDILLNINTNAAEENPENVIGVSECENQGSYRRTLDEYDVDAVQQLMNNDPRLWKISSADEPSGRQNYPIKDKRCTKCKEIGHLQRNCSNRYNLPKCILCGFEGHLDFKCPNKMCTQCGRKSPVMQSICEHCRHYKNINCSLCKMMGHPRHKCPDLWRRYHLTVTEGPLVKSDGMLLKEKTKLWCSFCAKSGHLEYYCYLAQKHNRFFRPLDPRIHSYIDVYLDDEDKQKSHNKKKSCPQDNLRSQNVDKSSKSENDYRTSQQNISASNMLQNTNFVSAVESPTSSMNNGIESLPNEFYVIDEVQNTSTNENLEERFNIEKDTENQSDSTSRNDKSKEAEWDCCQFFMTADIDSLKNFMKDELLLLRNSQFKVKDFLYRLIAYEEDERKPLCEQRIKIEKKQKFYKDLNMLVFGKCQFKGGKFHLRKLEMFIERINLKFSETWRKNLLYSFNYVFSSEKHESANYSYFLKIIQRKYGNQLIL